MASKTAFLILICCTWVIIPLSAQVKFEAAKIMTIEDGLSNNDIRTLSQSDDGFIWIGTRDGLSRFDGVDFKNYFHDPEDSTSIFDHRVHNLVVDGQNIWVGTQLGFSVFNQKTEQFKNYQISNCQLNDSLERNPDLRILSLDVSSSGEILLGTSNQGIVRFFPDKDSVVCYSYPWEKVPPNITYTKKIDYILSVHQDNFNDSLIWAGTTAGLLKVNVFTDEITWHFNSSNSEKTADVQNSFREIYQHDNGLLYLATWNAGVVIFDQEKEQFSSITLKNKSAAELADGAKILRNVINYIVRKSETEIWITSGAGLMEYNIISGEFTLIRKNQIKGDIKYGLSFIDDNDRGWLGTSLGLYVFDSVRQQFIEYGFLDYNLKGNGFTYHFPGLSAHGEIAVLARSSDGLLFLDPQKRSWRKVPFPSKYLIGKHDFAPRGWSISPNQHWTLANQNFIINFDPLNESFESIKIPAHLKPKNISAIHWDTNNRLWVGTRQFGLIRWTPDQNKWEHFQKELEVDSATSKALYLASFFEDSKKNIWFKREDGLSVFDSKRDTFYNFSTNYQPEISISPARAFAEDQNGKVWILGAEGILGYAHTSQPDKGVIKKYDLRESNQIRDLHYLKSNSQGMLWGLSEKGLFLINPENLEVKDYNLKYGIDNPNFFGFNVLPDDRLLIGGRNKVWIADPKNLVRNAEAPKCYLTSISILEEPLSSDTSINYLSQLQLKHWENFFSIGFSAIGFTLGEENEFRYQLEGLNEKWIDAGDQRIANYTNVPSGQYTFKLQAKNNEGVWNNNIFTLPIVIDTPWWKRTYFYILAGLAIILLVYGIYRFRLQQLLKEERVRSDFERRLLEVEMSALRAQMNPHFLFNCLNSIERYVIINDTKKASKYLNNFARLIRMILQNSRSNYIKLTDEITTLKLYLEMESLRFQEKFNYQINVSHHVHPDTINIPPMLLQPFVENAIWHGLMNKKDKENGLIIIDLNQKNGYLICTVEDNGVGREAAEKIKLRRPVTGKKSIGLKITNDRIQMLNQVHNFNTSIDIVDLKTSNGIARGTRVILKIPI